MKLLPKENITYKTKLKEVEIINRLYNLINFENELFEDLFENITINKYEGEISGNTFNIKRYKLTRENFLPRISGVITNDFDGTTIQVKMKLNTLITVFLYVWSFIYGIIFVVFTIKSFIDLEIYIWSVISLVMLIFAYASAMIGFKYESIISKKDLALAFDADIVDG